MNEYWDSITGMVGEELLQCICFKEFSFHCLKLISQSLVNSSHPLASLIDVLKSFSFHFVDGLHVTSRNFRSPYWWTTFRAKFKNGGLP